ncbi:MAG: hypothetical protein LW721_17775 [Flammeovirgaceae bacterium]|nr:hypothetical protein [Flammeovirgaceae bacterium]
MTTSSPILIENGIVGFVENLDKSKKGSQVSVCIPNPIKIPKDSKVFAGYIDRLGFGIQIIRGTQEEFFDTGDIVSGVYKDTIMLENANVDSLLIKKLEDVTNDINGRRKRR